MPAALPTDAEILYTSIYTQLVVLRSARIVWVTRFSPAFPDIETAKAELTSSTKTLLAQRDEYGLLLDLREVRGRNDSPFEATLQTFREQMFHGYKRVAFVVRTAIGELQIQRHGRESGVLSRVFRDIASARAYLTSEGV